MDDWLTLTRLRVAVFRFTLMPSELLELAPATGSQLRGVLGATLQRLTCAQRGAEQCPPCRLGNLCPYGYMIETSGPAEEGASDTPSPFVIEPPMPIKLLYRAGEPFCFELVLIGGGIAYLPFVILAFQEQGQQGLGRRRARYDVARVEARDPLSGELRTLYEAGSPRPAGHEAGVTVADVVQHARRLPADGLTLRFATPTRLKHERSFVFEPEFHVLVRALRRRIAALALVHGDERWDADFGAMIGAARNVRLERRAFRWVERERYSMRQRQDVRLDGFVGSGSYRGDLGPFRGMLALGAIVHVGKSAVFGNGRYDIADSAETP